MSGPRLSIIPAGAVTDARLEGRDLQVLALLGCHIDDDGWCFRSQARMARQLACGRATVQRSLDRLEQAGWIARRAEQRRDGGDTANSYRVILDVNGGGEGRDGEAGQGPGPAPEHGSNAAPDPADGGTPASPVRQGGASPVRRGPPAHGRAPIGTTPNERIEREGARADEEIPDPELLARFRREWPTTAIDRPKAVEAAWRALTAAEREIATTSIAAVLAARKAAGRKHALGAVSYLGDRAWEPVLAAGGAAAVLAAGGERPDYAPPLSKRFWACAIHAGEIGLDPGAMRRRRTMLDQNVGWRIEPGAMRAAVERVEARLVATLSASDRAAAWCGWLAARGFDFRDRLSVKPFWLFLPDHAPPDGAIIEGADELADGL